MDMELEVKNVWHLKRKKIEKKDKVIVPIISRMERGEGRGQWSLFGFGKAVRYVTIGIDGVMSPWLYEEIKNLEHLLRSSKKPLKLPLHPFFF